MSLNVIAKTHREKKVTFLGDRRYNIQDIDRYKYFGKDNYDPIVKVGAEVLTNGLFTVNADGWSLGAGITWVNGAIRFVAVASPQNMNQVDADQDTPIVLGEKYEVIFTISDYSGSGKVRVSVGSTGIGIDRSSNGTFTETIVAAGVNSFKIQVRSGNNFTGTIDSVFCTLVFSDQTVSIGATKDVDISSAFTDLDINRYDIISIGATSDDETLCVVTLTSRTNVRLFGISAGTAVITLTGKDLKGKMITSTFNTVVS